MWNRLSSLQMLNPEVIHQIIMQKKYRGIVTLFQRQYVSRYNILELQKLYHICDDHSSES